MNNFDKWLDTFLDEKGISQDTDIEVIGENGMNFMTVGVIVEMMKASSDKDKSITKNRMIDIDSKNGSILDFIILLAKASTL